MEKIVAIRELFESLYLGEKNLSAGQLDFVSSLKKYYARNKQLSEKQLEVLREIKKYLPAQDARFSGLVADNKKQDNCKIFINDM